MKDIRKGPEPPLLQRYRRQTDPPPTFRDLPTETKDQLRRRLYEDQGGICCYCMGRLDERTARIEHWHPQGRHSERALDWRNLLLACHGGEGQPPPLQHCDYSKGDEIIRLNPLDRVEHRFHYWSNGRLAVDEPSLHAEAETVLNLNALSLRRARQAAISTLIEVLDRRRGGKWSAERLQRKAAELRERSTDGRFVGYCMALVYWLEKKARQRR